MSGSGDIIAEATGVAIVGAVVLPIAISGLMIAGAVSAVKGAAGWANSAVAAGKKAHAENVQRRINTAYAKAEGCLANAAAVQSEINEEYARAASTVYSSYENALNELSESFGSEPDAAAFAEQYAASKQAFADEFQSQMAAIDRQYITPMTVAVNKTSAQLADERESILSSINAISSDIAAREAKSQAVAQEVIGKARDIISEFTAAHKGSAHAQGYAETLTNALNTAVERFNGGHYEAAIIDAYDVYSKCVTTVQSLLAEDSKLDVLYDRCVAAIRELEQNLANTQVSDYEFNETADGNPVRYEQLDMTPYYLGARESIQARLENLKSSFAAKDKYGFTPEEIIDLITAADELNIQLVRQTVSAFERLHNHLERLQLADIISASYSEMGFEEVEPDEAPSPLEAIVVQMESPEGEVVKIYLSVQTDENSHIKTGIDILSHADTIDRTTEQRRNSQRENVCNSIMNSEYGKRKGIVAAQRCKGGTSGKNAF